MQVQKAAEHLMSIADGRSREVAGSTGAKLQALITSIQGCGYFDQPEEPAAEPEDVQPEEPAPENVQTPVEEHVATLPPAPQDGQFTVLKLR